MSNRVGARVTIARSSRNRTLTRRLSLTLAALTLTAVGSTDAASLGASQQDFVAWQNSISEATNTARAQLQSGEPREIAWGAFRAAAYRLRGLGPEVIAAIEQSPTGHLSLEQSTMLASLFDAGVQLDLAMPAALLKRFWQMFPVQTSVLLARATGDRATTLLDLARSTNGLRWFAVANALLEASAPGFAYLILKDVQFRILVAVSEDGTRTVGESAGSSCGVADGIGLNPSGFPPKALYSLGLGTNGEIVLSSGPRTVYYRRTVEYQAQFGASTFDVAGPTDEERFQYVTALAGSEWSRMSLSRSEPIRWQNGHQLIEDVAAVRSAAEYRYRALVEALTSAGRLTAQEADGLAKPAVEIKLVDTREDKSIPLPNIQ